MRKKRTGGRVDGGGQRDGGKQVGRRSWAGMETTIVGAEVAEAYVETDAEAEVNAEMETSEGTQREEVSGSASGQVLRACGYGSITKNTLVAP